MLKQHHEREQSAAVGAVVTSPDPAITPDSDVHPSPAAVPDNIILPCSLNSGDSLQQNQALMNDLEAKLSHLPPEERKELAALIKEFQPVFRNTLAELMWT
ncbi:hypothetical protein Pcinc_000618 [Petrolisthes cinctipes]|uniref:Uncharacterized protein n=1 Tax=Petrolisthes cinctipes TaxID=88211 RepID=A0AAE1GMZ3_PETCI|nr:hypothetical protein Pcinc_000618 [Petrolisthes cinctipes]